MEEYTYGITSQQKGRSFYKKRLYLFLVFLLVAAGLLVWYVATTTENRRGKVPVSVYIVPTSAQVTVSGIGEVKSTGTIYLSEGEYRVTVQKSGYSPIEQSLKVHRDTYPNIHLQLDAVSKSAQLELADSTEALLELQRRQGATSAQFTKKFKEKYPIVKFLPIHDPYYKIGYLSDDSTDIYITIYTESPRYRYNALQRIRSLGFSPSDYRINFMDYQSPLYKEPRYETE